MSLAISKLAAFASAEHAGITPKQQLELLTLPLTQAIAEPKLLPLAVADIIVQYAADPNLICWYMSLKRLKALPKRIPRLPGNIDQILNSRCPIFWNLRKPDGSYYRVTDTHVLTLIPKELGSLNLFAKRIQLYCQKHKLKDVDAFQFRHFWEPARVEHGHIPFERMHWELMTYKSIPGSQYYTPAQLDTFIAALKKKIYVVYKPLSLKNTIVALFLHKLAMGVSLYPKGKEENGSDAAFTLVQESTQSHCLLVGSFASNGLVVSFLHNQRFGIGSGARRQFF